MLSVSSHLDGLVEGDECVCPPQCHGGHAIVTQHRVGELRHGLQHNHRGHSGTWRAAERVSEPRCGFQGQAAEEAKWGRVATMKGLCPSGGQWWPSSSLSIVWFVVPWAACGSCCVRRRPARWRPCPSSRPSAAHCPPHTRPASGTGLRRSDPSPCVPPARSQGTAPSGPDSRPGPTYNSHTPEHCMHIISEA